MSNTLGLFDIEIICMSWRFSMKNKQLYFSTEFSLEPDESSIWVSELQKRQESVTLNLNFYYELNTPNFRFDSLCCYRNIFRANVLLLEIISFEWIWSLFYKSVRKTYFWLDISAKSKFIYSNELPWSYYILFGKILMIALNDFV